MRILIKMFFTTVILVFLSACGSSNGSQTLPTVTSDKQSLGDVNFGSTQNKVPTLVVIMNWTNYSENDPLVWHNKIFNKEYNSVNRWYYDSMDANIELSPVQEDSGTVDDGVIIVNMNKAHPGSYNDTTFRDTEIRNAITSSTVVNSMDFSALDTNGDGDVSHKELQIIFIVAGGEESIWDSEDKSIWAHSWSYESDNAPKIDGLNIMRYTGDDSSSGTYSRFGAVHGIDTRNAHKATIGIIAHELGHSLFNLEDYYPTDVDKRGSGLGYYDIMSGGSWAKKTIDSYDGDTPIQFSAYNKIDAKIDTNVTVVSSAQNITIKCSSNELVKLTTALSNEYFLLECRDSARVDSDRSFSPLDPLFTDDNLFAFIYHVDTDKENNNEDGEQISSNHYKVRLIERDTRNSLTYYADIEANFSDAYTDGDVADSRKVKTYDGVSGYNIEVLGSDYTDRTMTFKITK